MIFPSDPFSEVIENFKLSVGNIMYVHMYVRTYI